MKTNNTRWSALFVILLTTIVHSFCFAQTKYYEDIVINHYFTRFISNINDHLSPTLSAAERKMVTQVAVEIDSTVANARTLKSDSRTKTITFGIALIRDLVKFSVSELIDFDTAAFDRKRFSAYYLSLYPYLAENTYPEDAAELTIDQRAYIRQIGDTNEFSWTITGKIMFVYLHELAHQFQDYSTQFDKITKNKDVKERDSLLLNLELEADHFAIVTIAEMNLNPVEYADVLSYFSILKEERFSIVQQLVFRQFQYFSTCHQLFSCEQYKDKECTSIKKRLDQFSILYNYYNTLYSTQSLKNIRKKAIEEKDAHALYNLGDFYLKSTSVHELNIDSALVLYETIGMLKADEANLYGTTSLRQFNDIYEYATLVTGKIYELRKEDPLRAIPFYEKAKVHSRFLSNDYYTKLLKRLKNK